MRIFLMIWWMWRKMEVKNDKMSEDETTYLWQDKRQFKDG